MATDAAAAPMKSIIFVSYRRADSQGWAGRLADKLSQAFGDVALFFDIEAIGPGEKFVDVLERALGDCQVLVALIGPLWLSIKADGCRRLENPDDVVRTEIATAMRKQIPVIPVLLGGAPLPKSTELPIDIASLPQYQALEISDTRWDYDCGKLIEALARITALPIQDGETSHISVGDGLTIERSKVGDVTGMHVEGSVEGASGPEEVSISVLHGATVRDSTLGNLTGKSISGKARTDK